MRIGIDARFVGPQGTGLGKYTEKLIENLQKIDSRNHYTIFLGKNNWNYIKLTKKNFSRYPADTPWYSIAEQIKLPKIFESQNLDLLHIPHFNGPLFYKGKFVVTIHDLIHHHFKEQSTTTRNQLLFKIKRIGYQIVIKNAIKRSEKIIVPSDFVKEEILSNFKVSADKIVVTYEAAEEEYFKGGQRSNVKGHPSTSLRIDPELNRMGQMSKTLVYVGNAYPHKNLNRLLDAFKILTTHYPLLTTHLVFVCSRDVFTKRLEKEIAKRDLDQVVQLKGYLKADQLSKLFSESSAYVFPSLSEGFGIPGLNAMASNLPVVCSNIPTLREVYGDAALYFDPNDPKDIASKIKKILTNEKIRADLVKQGKEQVKKYSWQKMAKETLKIYQHVL